MYNTTNLTAATGLHDTWSALEALSGGVLGVALTFTIWIFIFILMKKRENDTKQVMLLASFITAVVSVLLWAADLVGIYGLLFPAIATFGSIVVFLFSD